MGKDSMPLHIPLRVITKFGVGDFVVCCSIVTHFSFSTFFLFFFLLFLSCNTQDFPILDFCFVFQVVPLASVIVKEAMTDEDVLNCQKTIYNLVDMERKNDPLPISTVGTRGKGPKRLNT